MREKAVLLGDSGEQIKVLRIPKHENKFKWKTRQYVVMRKEVKPIIIKKLFFKHKYYYYNVNNPYPLNMGKKAEPLVNTEIFNALMETKVLIDLNKIKKGLFDGLDFKMVLIGLVVIGVIIYFARGGSLT